MSMNTSSRLCIFSAVLIVIFATVVDPSYWWIYILGAAIVLAVCYPIFFLDSRTDPKG